MSDAAVAVFHGPELAAYGFGRDHPFGPDRHDAWWAEMVVQGLPGRVSLHSARLATEAELLRFHTPEHIARVAAASVDGLGMLDAGDTPAFVGCYEASAHVVGAALDAVAGLVEGRWRRAFVPIAGLHHARRHVAAGFCVFNDCGAAIEALRAVHGIRRVAYVDIDAHHGDGVFYDFEDDPDLIFADIHQDGRTLYPGTGHAWETGRGAAEGTKLNLPLPPFAGDEAFFEAFAKVEEHLDAARPELVLLQCGADSIAGDPLTHLQLSPEAHGVAATRLCALAERHGSGRLLAVGGGGYNRRSLALGWTGVVRALLEAPTSPTSA